VILRDGVQYDAVVQRQDLPGGGCFWLLADSDGTVYARFSTEDRARRALTDFEARLLAAGGRRTA
jgi:hypothetical protein